MARKANLVIDAGSHFYTEIVLTDASGDAIDISTYVGTGKIKKHWGSANSTTLEITTANNGAVGIFLAGNTSVDMEMGRYVYDVYLTANNGVPNRVVEGLVTIKPGVTR